MHSVHTNPPTHAHKQIESWKLQMDLFIKRDFSSIWGFHESIYLYTPSNAQNHRIRSDD